MSAHPGPLAVRLSVIGPKSGLAFEDFTLGHGKPLALLAALSAGPQRSASRASLISLLWADLEPDAAKHALRQTLWYLKKKTGQDVIIAEGDTLRLASFVTVDRDDLLEASRAGDHLQVVELYTGPFIPDFAAPGGSGFEEWAALERRRLLEVFRHSAELVVAQQLGSGHAREAINLARRLRDQDLYHEGGWRLLIEACLSANDTLGARAEAEALAQLAEREELDLELATRATLRAARQPADNQGNHREAPGDDALAPSLVGREREFAALLQAWDSARSGRLVRVHVTARAGIGKSRLLRDFGARLRGLRAKVVTAGGTQGQRDIDYAVASELCAGMAALPGKQALSPASAATLVDLNPSLSTFFDKAGRPSATGDQLRLRALAIRELLRAVAFEHPVALLIDDLHWWDEASVALLSAVLEGAGDVRLLVVSAGRPEVRTSSFVRGTDTKHLALDPLSAGHIEELLLSIASLPADPWAAALPSETWRATRGSPLLALELLQHLESRQLLAREDGQWTAPDPGRLSEEFAQVDVLPSRLRELERGDLWLLTLLGVAGGPLAQSVLARAADRTANELGDRLAALEARGFVARDGDLVRCAHDEIAEEGLRVAGHEASVRAATQLGAVLSETRPVDEGQLRRAMRLLRTSPLAAPRHDAFRRFATHRFGLGDRRTVRALARDILGPSASADEVAQLASSAPWSWRAGLTSPIRQGVAGISVVIGTLGLAALLTMKPAPTEPDAVLAMVFVGEDRKLRYETVDLRTSGWAPRDTLTSTLWDGPPVMHAAGSTFNIDHSRVSRQFVTSQAVADSGVIDIFLHEPDGRTRRLTRSIRDDEAPTFSPDGRFVAFATAQWDSLYRYDVAVAEVATGRVRQLTRGPASDGRASWSPDGTRLAFDRSNWGLRPTELCVVSLSGAETCRSVAEHAPSDVLGWLDRDRIVIFHFTTAVQRLRVVQWSTGETTTWFEGRMSRASLSPDGRWVFCVCALEPGGEPGSAVFPMGAPHLMRPVRWRGAEVTSSLSGAVWLQAGTPDLTAALTVDRPPPLPANTPSRLTVTLKDRFGGTLADDALVRWSILDGAGAIDSVTGVVVPTGATPTVKVAAARGTSARDTATLKVDTRMANLLLDEEWTDLSAWVPYGAPAPSVGRVRGLGTAFLSNGEGSFESGAVSRVSASDSSGLYVEATVLTPITLPQWQFFRLTFTASGEANYGGALGRNAPPFVSPSGEACDVGFPLEGRFTGMQPILALTKGSDASVRIPLPELPPGRPWTVRMQLFPDGRCGLAINGKPVGILNTHRHLIGPLHVRVAGNSYMTTIAVGRLRFYEGVGTDIDWQSAPVFK